MSCGFLPALVLETEPLVSHVIAIASLWKIHEDSRRVRIYDLALELARFLRFSPTIDEAAILALIYDRNPATIVGLPSLSIRSMEYRPFGRGPISAGKFSKRL